jgi:hypothetical protein
VDIAGATSVPFTPTAMTMNRYYRLIVTNGSSDPATTTGLLISVETPGIPCFAEGTRILTQNGYKAIETLTSNDLLITADNRTVTFKRLKTTLRTTTGITTPYLIQPHAFGRNLPSAPIRLSPTHKIQLRKGLWISPYQAALTNPLVTQCEIGGPMTYYHLECKEYLRDDLVTEGLVVESFGSRKATGGRKDIYTWSKRLNAYTRVGYGTLSKTA